MADPEARYTVQVDIYTARRQRVHQVIDGRGIPVYHDKHILNVLDWLAERDIRDARFTDDATAFLVTFARADLQPTPELETQDG